MSEVLLVLWELYVTAVEGTCIGGGLKKLAWIQAKYIEWKSVIFPGTPARIKTCAITG